MRLTTFIGCFILTFSIGLSQSNDCYKVTDKKTIKLYDKALEMMRINPGGAIKMFKEEVLSRDNDYVQVHHILSEYYFGKLNEGNTAPGRINRKATHEKAIHHLQEVHRICPGYLGHIASYKLGIEYDMVGEKEKSIQYFNYYLEHEAEKPKDKEEVAKRIVNRNTDILEVLANPVDYNPFDVKGINTEKDEYLPMLSPDNNYIYFTRKTIGNRPKATFASTNGFYEEFLMARKMSVDSFSTGFPVPCDLNEPNFEVDGYRVDGLGGVTITPDNKHIYITVMTVKAVGGSTGVKHADIYYADFKDGKWSDFRSLDVVNNAGGPTWEGQPTISSDGKTIIFASARDSSTQYFHPLYQQNVASMDLFEIHRLEDGSWSEPKNLGPNINTKQQEKTPFLHTDSKTLYFASNGHSSVGGYDIFYSRQDKFGNWSPPKNIGVPINNEIDQHGFIVSLDGKYGFLTDGKEGDTETGGLQIISFEIPEKAKPQKLVFVTGKLETNDHQPIEDAKVEIKNSKTGEITEAMVDKNTGEYVAILTVEDETEEIEVNGEKIEQKKEEQEPVDFILTAKKEDHAFSSTVVTVDNDEIDGAKKERGVDIQVDPIKVGKPYRINDINFATNSYELTHRTMLILDEFIDFLVTNPGVTVAIHGHTDNQGNASENMELSKNRAKAVHDYLMINDIDPSRLSFKGFGSTKPVASNNSESGRAQNRRTEFVILTK